MTWIGLLAQTTTTSAGGEASRNNAALPLMFLAVVALGFLAIAGPVIARRVNARRSADTRAQ